MQPDDFLELVHVRLPCAHREVEVHSDDSRRSSMADLIVFFKRQGSRLGTKLAWLPMVPSQGSKNNMSDSARSRAEAKSGPTRRLIAKLGDTFMSSFHHSTGSLGGVKWR